MKVYSPIPYAITTKQNDGKDCFVLLVTSVFFDRIDRILRIGFFLSVLCGLCEIKVTPLFILGTPGGELMSNYDPFASRKITGDLHEKLEVKE
jgi:hypothetical protein